MFSGIVETKVRLLNCTPENRSLLRLTIPRPHNFNDLHIGDSVAVNGVCLTVDRLGENTFDVVVAHETLTVTGWTPEILAELPLNLERSLAFGARVHGHPTSGHADEAVKVVSAEEAGGGVLMQVELPSRLRKFVWPKGSVAVNGVSLTVNRVDNGVMEFCLIPETLRRTNLGDIRAGAKVNIEVDPMARAVVHTIENEAGAR